LKAAGIVEGLRIHLEKRIPLAAGLGGGSGNAAITLLALNELFGEPLADRTIGEIAALLGSDVPFFLQSQPALATGRGEIIEPLAPFPALRGLSLVLVHPGFGVSTAWAYQQLPRFPEAFRGQPGRGRQLVAALQTQDLVSALGHFYNALEAPVLAKHPLLGLYQKFFREQGALAALMSGSGSSTFALVRPEIADSLVAALKAKYTPDWTQTLRLA
jgi:4-diphosphocytidyl-2-C-methyl-D-erythritol kinase